MKFGLHSVSLHTCSYPETAARLAQAVGYNSRKPSQEEDIRMGRILDRREQWLKPASVLNS